MGPSPQGNLFEDIARGLPQGTAYMQPPMAINHKQPMQSISSNSFALT
jgi:hypothetical protein